MSTVVDNVAEKIYLLTSVVDGTPQPWVRHTVYNADDLRFHAASAGLTAKQRMDLAYSTASALLKDISKRASGVEDE